MGFFRPSISLPGGSDDTDIQAGKDILFKLLKRSRHSIIAEEAKSAGNTEEGPKGVLNSPTPKKPAWAENSLPAEGSLPSPSLLEGDLGYNRFAKFTQVADAQHLWSAVAEELAAYAAEARAPLDLLKAVW